jgi:hypothetical protein
MRFTGRCRGIILVILLFFPFFSWGLSTRVEEIRALKTEGPSLLNSYLDLMESQKLIHQTDNRLKKRHLLKKNGGLCGFTAQVDTIQSVSNYFQIAKSKFLKRPDYFLYQIIEEARAYMTDDPAYEGAILADLGKYTENVLEKYGLDEIIHIEYTDKKSDIDPEKFKSYYWKMRMIGLASEDGEEAHTVVVLKVNVEKKLIYLSDPNYPNKVITVPYKESRRGLEVFLTDDFPGFQPALANEMIEVNVAK